MVCTECKEDHPVDIINWSCLPCPKCKSYGEDSERQLEKYKEFHTMLTVKGEVEFDKVCEWCVTRMEGVFSDRLILS